MTRSQVGGVDFVWEICLPFHVKSMERTCGNSTKHTHFRKICRKTTWPEFEIVETTSNLNGYNLCKENLIVIGLLCNLLLTFL